MNLAPPLRANWLKQISVVEGGMAFVYICEPKDGFYEERQRVAVKRLKPSLGNDEKTERLFLRECFLWMQAGAHPNIVSALSAHEVRPEQSFVVLDYVPQSLRSWKRRKSLSVADVLRVGTEICFGLEYMQSVSPGFIHRDLKPENVLVSSEGTAKVTDFGLAHIRAISSDPSSASGVTAPAGTPDYMAPEQFRGEESSESTDVYAIGCILYELLAGAPVFGWLGSFEEWQTAHVVKAASPLSERNRKCPKSIDTIVLNCLHKSPLDRFKTVRDLRHALEAAGLAEYCIRARASGSGTRSVGQLLLAGQGLHNLGYYTKGNEIFAEVLSTTDQSVDGAAFLAKLKIADGCVRSGNIAEAERHISNLDINTGDVNETSKALYFSVLAALSDVKGEDDLALKYCEEAVRCEPGGSAGWHNLATSYEKANRLDDAEKAVRRALEISPNAKYFCLAMDILSASKQYEAAWELSKHAIRLHPSSTTLLRYCAMSAFILEALRTKDQNFLSNVARDMNRIMQDAPNHGIPVEYVNEIMIDCAESIVTIGQPADQNQSKSDSLLSRAKTLRSIADSFLRCGKAEAALLVLRKSHKLVEEAENAEEHERKD
jgi:tetratricopeptide (TPR) repeat protein